MPADHWRNRIVGHADVDPKTLVPNERNWRRHPKHQADALGGVLTEVGTVQSVIVNKITGRLVDGHLRLDLALKSGQPTVPVVYVELEPEEEALVLATLDPVAALAEADGAKLDELLRDVTTGNAAVMEMVAELAKQSGLYFGEPEPQIVDVEPQIDRAEELNREWKVKSGDLWLLGDHRLLCGDSTKAEDVGRLFSGVQAKAVLFATDPPYGIAYGVETGSNNYSPIANDENDGPKLQAFLESVFYAWVPYLADNAAWYLWHAHLTQGFFAAAAAADVILHRQIIWVKPSLILGHGDYHWRHEPCFYGWRKGHRPPFFGDRTQTTVWELSREANLKVHPTQKPTEVFALPIKHHTRHVDIVAEPFCGSGSQLIAAEQLGRKCYAIEIEPKYIAVTLQRWADATGKTPELERA